MRFCITIELLALMLALPEGLLAQDAESGSEGSEAPAVVDAWQEADALQQADDYQAAADRYLQILAAETHWKKQQRAALMAGQCLDQAGNGNEAITLYDQVIAIADQQQARGHDGPVMFWAQVALAGRAFACEQLGDVEGARYAIERLKVEYPKSNYTLRVLEVQARLDGRPPEAVRDHEEQALALAEQLSDLVKADQKSEALALADQIITEFPTTAAVYPALRTKALILWGQGDYRQSRAVYEGILTRCRPVAPHCRLVRTAEYRAAWLDAGWLLKDLVARRRRASVIPPEQWQQVDALCAEIVAKDPNPTERAMAKIMAIEALSWQGRSEEVVTQCDEFLKQHEGSTKLITFKEQIGAAHVYAGIALRRLGRYEEALGHFQWVLHPPEGQAGNWLGHHTLDAARRHEWLTLRESGAEISLVEAIQRYRSSQPDETETSPPSGE